MCLFLTLVTRISLHIDKLLTKFVIKFIFVLPVLFSSIKSTRSITLEESILSGKLFNEPG